MASLSLATPVNERLPLSTTIAQPTLLVATFGDDVAADFAAHVAGARVHVVDLSQTTVNRDLNSSACVLFLKRELTEDELRRLDAVVTDDMTFIGIVSSFRVHLDDALFAQTETRVLKRLRGRSKRIVVFRPGHVLSPRSHADRFCRRLGFAYPTVPRRMQTCFVDGAELFTAIERERHDETQSRRPRIVTLLGPNRPIRHVMRERAAGWMQRCLSTVCFLIALLQVGQVLALIVHLIPSLRGWNVTTLRPRSFAELLTLCNRHNFQHVKVVGYNNGVTHFGHRFPGKTIVTTIRCNSLRRLRGSILRADCGATIRQAMDFLASSNQELHVIPNYSYVCLGTAFYVPIHGSASDFATVAETLTRVLLFDPIRERMILADSDEQAFRDAVYNLSSNLIVLRLWMRVKSKSRYYAQHQQVETATSQGLLDALNDETASNVEIRKAGSTDTHVTISKYYVAPESVSADVIEVPRDKLGRLWDRLEENRVTSFLMHAFARTLIWHVELFFTAEEFAVFWRTHQTLPLRKIQLRRMRRDGLPHSPFCAHDCVSVDLFLFRWNRAAFEAYLKQTFAVIRSNPGKHSQ